MTAAALPSPPPPPWQPADPEALRRALEASGASELPGPSFGEYLLDVTAWLRDLLVEMIEVAAPGVGWSAAERGVLLAVLGAAAIAVVALTVAAIGRYRRRAAEMAAAGEPVTASSPMATADADWWRAELGRRLDSGALRAALEALWWWVARRLDPPGLDVSWTTGELLRVAAAAPLREPLRRLERLQWGGPEPRRDDVDALVLALREALR